MDFAFSAKQDALRRELRDFLRRECPPSYVRECDENERFPHSLFKSFGARGWFALSYPEQYGGGGGDEIDLAILLEEVGYAFCDFANTVTRLSAISGMHLLRYGNEEQKSKYLGAISRGNCNIAFGLTEPEAGSDIGGLKTSAVLEDDHYIVNGLKSYATGSDVADLVIIGARTQPGIEEHKGISLLIVDLKSEGLKVKRVPTLGVRATGTADLAFDGVSVPKQNLIGEEGKGWDQMLAGVETERSAIAAVCAGAAQAALDHCRDYAQQRKQFGRSISGFQAVRHKFADMQIDIDIARIHAYHVAWMVKQKNPCSKEASFAKIHASEAYNRVAHDALQLTGGWGYRSNSSLQRHYRDAKMYEIEGGPSEVLRDIVAKRLGLP